jgi:hypothetical protein
MLDTAGRRRLPDRFLQETFRLNQFSRAAHPMTDRKLGSEQRGGLPLGKRHLDTHVEHSLSGR